MPAHDPCVVTSENVIVTVALQGSNAMGGENTGTAGADYDQLAVTGNVTLSGTLNLNLLNGFTPTLGDEFVIMTFASLTGTFSTTDLPDIAPNAWDIVYNASNVTLKVIAVLPLKLTSFTGKLMDNNQVQLNWQSSEEYNVSRYEIETSNDGNTWQKIGTSAATNKNVNQYSYLHTQGSSIAYYRLKMIDLDNKYSYSKTIAIKISKGPLFKVFPNPAKDILFVQANGDNEPVVLQIIDVTGRCLREEKMVLKGATSLSVDVKNLSKGVYHFILRKQSKTEQEIFIKQ